MYIVYMNLHQHMDLLNSLQILKFHILYGENVNKNKITKTNV